ncbi:MAG: hypothetical protein WC496_04540 [Phycisphaerae bacterium]|jgi:hypothetical protein
MKTKLQIITFYLLAVVLGGCVPSLHPLFTENERIFDANLVGIWSADSNEIWEFKPSGKGYECIYIDKDGKSGRFNTGLGKLQNNMFLDIFPGELKLTENDFYKIHFVPAHTFMRVNLTKDSLELRVMNPDGLNKLLKSEPNSIKYESPENGSVVLTASTKELQDFMLKYGIDEKYEIFGKVNQADKMHRIKAGEPNDVNDKQLKNTTQK